MKIYAALYDDVAEGFVWLEKAELPARCVVKITNQANGRYVFCEALQFDKNFLERYNQEPRISIESPASSIVMSYWYRDRLGKLETQTEYPLEPVVANSLCDKLRACKDHPQVVVRVAAWLAILSVAVSVAFGVLSVLLGVASLVLSIRSAKGNTMVSSNPSSTVLSLDPMASNPRSTVLSLDATLDWRSTYGDLLGKTRDAVIERFGAPKEAENRKDLEWVHNPRTGDRGVRVMFDSTKKDSVAVAVKVFARPTETLDAGEVLKKASMFKFSTGTYKDSLLSYFSATTEDGRNSFQFDAAETGVKFSAMIFTP